MLSLFACFGHIFIVVLCSYVGYDVMADMDKMNRNQRIKNDTKDEENQLREIYKS